MEFCKPLVTLVSDFHLDEKGMAEVAAKYGADRWFNEQYTPENDVSDSEFLIEFMARSCYKSFGVGLNPNVTKVREGNAEYLANVIDSGHGSVLEHIQLNFMFQDVSRVFTHELVRHRPGVAISQESLRYVRLTDLKCFDFPRLKSELTDEEEEWFRAIVKRTFEYLESVQDEMTDKFNLNNEESFARKKKLTSRMRRLAPIGLLTNIGWSANFRTLRHVIPLRTSKAAEEEIRWVFADVGEMCKRKYPNIFFDMEWNSDDDGTGLGEWKIIPKRIRDLNKFLSINFKENMYILYMGKTAIFSHTNRFVVNCLYDNISIELRRWGA